MSGKNLDLDELWIVAWALLTQQLTNIAQRDRCRSMSQRPQTTSVSPERFAEWANDAEVRIAGLDAVVAKLLPDDMRAAWSKRLDERLAAEAAQS